MSATADRLPASRPLRATSSRYWSAVAVVLAVPAAAALATVALAVLHPQPALLQHLLEHVLPDVVLNTLALVIAVTATATVLGVSLAWLTAIYEFPGRRLFSWALLLPMAMPAYVIGFVAIGLLDYSGPLQSALRALTGSEVTLPAVRSRAGVVAALSFALYPYVYLLARNAFLSQGQQALEVAQSLGLSRSMGFVRVALPLARPWIAGGAMLVVMETLADFGTVSVFNYDTFTTAIYRTWFALFSVDSALQLAFFLLTFVALALFIERRLRGRAGYAMQLAPRGRRLALSAVARWAATSYAALVLGIGFVVPAIALCAWAVTHLGTELDLRYAGYVLRSLSLAALAAVTITGAALVLAYSVRLSASRASRAAARLATLGYALPGTVLAVAIHGQLTQLNAGFNALLAGSGATLFLQGTLLAMLLAYFVRFLAVAHQSVDAAMQRITPGLDEASQSLGIVGWRLLGRVHVPLLRGGLATALVLVFVDVMKEMPITLMTRPFGWDTLAVRVYEMTAEGRWEQAALPALTIVAAGLVPVLLITRASGHAIATR